MSCWIWPLILAYLTAQQGLQALLCCLTDGKRARISGQIQQDIALRVGVARHGYNHLHVGITSQRREGGCRRGRMPGDGQPHHGARVCAQGVQDGERRIGVGADGRAHLRRGIAGIASQDLAWHVPVLQR